MSLFLIIIYQINEQNYKIFRFRQCIYNFQYFLFADYNLKSNKDACKILADSLISRNTALIYRSQYLNLFSLCGDIMDNYMRPLCLLFIIIIIEVKYSEHAT